MTSKVHYSQRLWSLKAFFSQAALLIILTGTGNAFAWQNLGEDAVRQIKALHEEKVNRTPVQRKISSSLLYELGKSRGEALFSQLPNFKVPRNADDNGIVLIDIHGKVNNHLLQQIPALGGSVVTAHPKFSEVRARLPLDVLEQLAQLPEVQTIRPADQYMTQITTEGDASHGADTARVTFGVDGTGVQVGAMSDSVDALGDLQAAGELPPTVTVLPGQSGNPGTSEGTALMEIVHDMAPGADLFFATGQGGQAQMAQNILDLQAEGCDIIVDDVAYFAEPVFQDGVIAQAVDAVAAAGVVYFSSAGNSGNLNDGESGVWEGDYNPGSLPAPLAGTYLSAHDFGGNGSVAGNTVTTDSPFFFSLQWADPQGSSSNDYDLLLLDDTLSTVLAASTNVQSGTQNPFEIIDSQSADHTGAKLVVALFAGSPRFLHMNTHRGRLEFGTDGQIAGHAAAEGALAVAAVFRTNSGPFTGGAANPVEPFSSDGPRRIFFNPDGSPVSTDGPISVVRPKPDIAAADGVMTGTPGFNPFFGTSASAPHAAGVAALFSELFPSIPLRGAIDIFKSSALDIEEPGFDRDSGAGIIMAEEALGTPIFVDGFESGDTSAWTK